MKNWQSYLPKVLPDGWRLNFEGWENAHYSRNDGLNVITRISLENDAKYWIHIILFRDMGKFSPQDMTDVKKLFVGEDSDKYLEKLFIDDTVGDSPWQMHLCYELTEKPIVEFYEPGYKYDGKKGKH